MALDIPVPTESPYDDPDQYLPLILSAIEGFLLAKDVWSPETYEDARGYIEQLKVYAVECWGKCGDGTMIGEIKIWSTSNVPVGYLLCNGQEVSRVDYQALFDMIGTTYGAGDGTTFNLPDLRDRSPMGVNTIVGLGDFEGERTHTLDIAEIPQHAHGQTINGIAANSAGTSGGGFKYGAANSNNTSPAATLSAGSGDPHNNLHPVIGLNFIIFAGV
jgi:microcystin-dependent protein